MTPRRTRSFPTALISFCSLLVGIPGVESPCLDISEATALFIYPQVPSPPALPPGDFDGGLLVFAHIQTSPPALGGSLLHSPEASEPLAIPTGPPALTERRLRAAGMLRPPPSLSPF